MEQLSHHHIHSMNMGMYQEYDVASKLLNDNNKWCLSTIESRVKSGSNYKKIEDENNYKQLIDWTRIAQLGFVSENAKEVTEENYKKIITERSTIIHDELNTIKEGEAALFIISSGSHKFPEDMEIFNVIPPSLDKMNRWITENQNSLQDSNQEKQVQDEGEQDKQSGLWTP